MSTIPLFAVDWREVWQGQPDNESVGVVYTRPEVVDFILDLAQYSVGEKRLAEYPVLEPSCGDGAFLDAVVCRLIQSEAARPDGVEWYDLTLDAAVCATDISDVAVGASLAGVLKRLGEAGCPEDRAHDLAAKWVVQTDFLLTDWTRKFALVVGNPPYVRLEALPKAVLQEYRSRFATLTDRADLYVAFIEQGLRLLDADGCLAFICANRFAKNQYGAALRGMIANRFRVRQYVNLEHTQPFLHDVSAYPAVIVIDRQTGSATRAGALPDVLPNTLRLARDQALAPVCGSGHLAEFASWYPDGAPWRATTARDHAFLARLERFPLLEVSALDTKVGIGVATGADEVFVLEEKDELIEESRQIPLLMAADVRVDQCSWSGHYLVNPFAEIDDGSLIDLTAFPGLREHLSRHSVQLKSRHVARSRPNRWYRTIDRIWPGLQAVPKLMIPDIQGGGIVGLDDGNYYPHHNLYWVTSVSWPLRALQALLRSSHALQQVKAYSVQMRGGSLRYQAQTLRRLRIPMLATLSTATLERLTTVGESDNQAELDAAAAEAYGFELDEQGS